MVWFILLGALAAFGLWCCIYCSAGLFLTEDYCLRIICLLPPEKHPDGAIARYRFLKGLGLVRGPLLVLGDRTAPAEDDIEFCTVEELSPRLELERNHLD